MRFDTATNGLPLPTAAGGDATTPAADPADAPERKPADRGQISAGGIGLAAQYPDESAAGAFRRWARTALAQRRGAHGVHQDAERGREVDQTSPMAAPCRALLIGSLV
jgi:hypothetical protein